MGRTDLKKSSALEEEEEEEIERSMLLGKKETYFPGPQPPNTHVISSY